MADGHIDGRTLGVIYTTKHPGMIDGGLNIATKILYKNNWIKCYNSSDFLSQLLKIFPNISLFDLKFMSVRKIGSGGGSLVFSILVSVLSGQS